MTSTKRQRLDEAIAAIRHEWGEAALRQLGDPAERSTIAHLSTGFARLDEALGIGGLPKAHLSQLSGIPTSGATTLACKVLAQAVGEAAVVVDVPQTFDADYAARCGVNTASLLLIQPDSLAHALETLTALVDTAAVAVLALDTSESKRRVDPAALRRLVSALHRSSCVLIVLERSGSSPFSDRAAVRLSCQRERWLQQRQNVNGYRTQVRILKNQFGPSGQRVGLVIGFSGVVRGDGA